MSPDAFAPAVFPRLHAPDLDEAARAARVRGYAAGHAEGFRAAAAAAEESQAHADARRAARDDADARRIDEAVRVLDAAAQALAAHAARLTAAAHERMHAHAVELAELLVAGELSEPAARASAAVRRALSAAEPADIRTVRMHPDDLAALDVAGARPGGVALAADDALARGDAVVELADGWIDARIETALARARRALTEGDA